MILRNVSLLSHNDLISIFITKLHKEITVRRNTAMLARKQILLDGTITNGYLSFPVTLMV